MCSATRARAVSERFGVDDPTTDGRIAAFAGQPFELVDRDPAPFGDHPVHRPVGPGLGRAHDRVDVEDLATPDGLRAAALAQDIVVAGRQRQCGRHVQPGEAVLARSERSRPEDAQLHGVLAAAHVGDERAASRDVVVERGQHVERHVECLRAMPLGRPEEGVTAPDLVVMHTGEVHGGSVAGFDRVVCLTL